MSYTLFTDLSIFVLSVLVGIEVISKVPVTLHTPLMSAANAIHGIIVVGAILVAATADSPWAYALGFVATAFAAMNVVGGFVVTDRMLEMFRPRRQPTAPTAVPTGQSSAETTAGSPS